MIDEFKVTNKVYWPKDDCVEVRMWDKVAPDDEHHSHINEEGLVEVLGGMKDKINEMIKEINSLRDGVSTLGGKGSVKPII